MGTSGQAASRSVGAMSEHPYSALAIMLTSCCDGKSNDSRILKHTNDLNDAIRECHSLRDKVAELTMQINRLQENGSLKGKKGKTKKEAWLSSKNQELEDLNSGLCSKEREAVAMLLNTTLPPQDSGLTEEQLLDTFGTVRSMKVHLRVRDKPHSDNLTDLIYRYQHRWKMLYLTNSPQQPTTRYHRHLFIVLRQLLDNIQRHEAQIMNDLILAHAGTPAALSSPAAAAEPSVGAPHRGQGLQTLLTDAPAVSVAGTAVPASASTSAKDACQRGAAMGPADGSLVASDASAMSAAAPANEQPGQRYAVDSGFFELYTALRKLAKQLLDAETSVTDLEVSCKSWLQASAMRH